jgi:tetratricopeptide (TPR) repeat protein
MQLRSTALHSRSALALLCALPLWGCGSGGDGDGGGVGAQEPEWSGPPAVERSTDPRVVDTYAALENGRVGAARALLDQLGDSAGVEGLLLRGRLAILEQDWIGGLKYINQARKAAPEDPRPYAAAAELYAYQGLADDAQEQIQTGQALAGKTPELTRALAVLALTTPGAQSTALDLLESALRGDEDLPFTRLPMAQAQGLVALERLREGRAAEAEALVRSALEVLPADPELRRSLIDALKGQKRFEEAILELRALEAEGGPMLSTVREDLTTTLLLAATQAMIDKRRDLQVQHLLEARERGVSDADLGLGLATLRQEAATLVEAAHMDLRRAELMKLDPETAGLSEASLTQAAEARVAALNQAREGFQQALSHDPDSIEAHYFLGRVCFDQRDYARAAAAYRAVLERVDNVAVLPDPVPIELGKALYLNGEVDAARDVLRGYLSEYPGGRWTDDAEGLLASF